jgi:pSer/pThr/pTyr-binding forkhead associated (FHA) protein
LQNAEEVLAFFPKTESPNPPIPEIDATSQKNLVNGALWRIMQGEEFGKIYKLNELLTRGKKFLTVGRNESDSSNSIEIQEQLSCYISRKHCTLEWDRKQKKWKIKDGQEDKQNENGWKPSTNGTFVNSREVSPGGMYIQPGDIITIGDTTIKVEIY